MDNVSYTDIFSFLEKSGTNADLDKINGDTSLRDAGVDSLDMASLLLSIEEKYEINISDEDVGALDTIFGMVRYLQSR